MKGTIVQLRFRKDGEIVTFDADKMGEVSEISVSTRGDEITVGGEKWEGRIVDVKIKTIGGALAFKRTQFRGIEKKLSERERLLSEYRRKADALEELDAEGWLKLASWAGRNRLLRQEKEAARRSLEIDPDHPKNASAHRILGHVQKNGQWLTASEVKELEKQASAQKAAEMRAKGFVKVGSRWVSKDEMERIKSLKERIEGIQNEIYEEAEEWA
ncbi:MAG: hypothetical protein QF886_25045, partial [Planctomycetota bacterium]|nr:hypothetical protein [Planctomycetota bacterium]